MFINIINNNIFQSQNKNRRVLKLLKKLNYPLPRIRKALIILNGIKLADIAQDQTTASSLSKTIRKKSIKTNHRKKDKKLISQKLGLNIEELF
jgi:hypothetical protein